jgi:membrane protein DedA with SNARE-associated domain
MASRRRVWGWTAGVLVALVALLAVFAWLAPFDRESVELQPADGPWAYITVFALVFADAVCPVFPGETTLNAASTFAAEGLMDIGWVVVAGAVGAVLGDSALYWIAHFARSRVQRQLDAVMSNDKVVAAMEIIGSSAGSLLVFGRYVPGMRFVVNATLGLSGHPYPDFLRWSAVGGTLWSIYICTVAFLVGTALSGFPLASVAISALASSLAVVVVFWVLARRIRERRAAARAAS